MSRKYFFEFNEKEKGSITQFHERAGRLKETKLVKNRRMGYKVKLNARDSPIQFHEQPENLLINIEANHPQIEKKFPDVDELQSAILIIRNFTLTKDPINLHKIFGVLINKTSSDKCKDILKLKHKEFKNSIKSKDMKIESEGKEYIAKKAFDLWINGYYFHGDEEDKEDLKSIENQIDSSKMMFINILIIYTNAILWLDAVLTKAELFS